MVHMSDVNAVTAYRHDYGDEYLKSVVWYKMRQCATNFVVATIMIVLSRRCGTNKNTTHFPACALHS